MTLPSLDDSTRKKLAELNIWAEVYDQHQQAGWVAQSYSQVVKGSLLQRAIAQIAENELALAQSLKTLCKENRLGTINVGNHDSVPASEVAFRKSCHRSNLSLFLASGLYELASQDGYLQPDLLNLWNEVLNIQACHVLFFMNWLAFEAQVKQKPDYELSGLGSLWTHKKQWLAIFNKLNRSEYDDNLPRDPKQIDYFLGKENYSSFLDACERNYRDRFESLDSRLLRPRILLNTSAFFQTILGFWPQRRKSPRASSV